MKEAVTTFYHEVYHQEAIVLSQGTEKGPEDLAEAYGQAMWELSKGRFQESGQRQVFRGGSSSTAPKQRGIAVRTARQYDPGEIASLATQARLSLDERRCPRRSYVGMRRYFHLFQGSARTSLITYLWCPSCHGYDGSTVSGAGMTLDRDPMAELDESELRLAKANTESYLAKLDMFWESGKLPQRLTEPRSTGR